jgi:hypothetical protein
MSGTNSRRVGPVQRVDRFHCGFTPGASLAVSPPILTKATSSPLVGAAIFLGKFVILSEAKNLRDSGQILRFAQNDNWPMALSATETNLVSDTV